MHINTLKHTIFAGLRHSAGVQETINLNLSHLLFFSVVIRVFHHWSVTQYHFLSCLPFSASVTQKWHYSKAIGLWLKIWSYLIHHNLALQWGIRWGDKTEDA